MVSEAAWKQFELLFSMIRGIILLCLVAIRLFTEVLIGWLLDAGFVLLIGDFMALFEPLVLAVVLFFVYVSGTGGFLGDLHE